VAIKLLFILAFILPKEYTSVTTFVQENEKEIIAQLGPAYPVTLAIVAPEIIRYNRFRDFFETESLRLIYVEHGAEVVDFSIGPFQMKPSFVEKLENKLKADSFLYLQFTEICAYPTSDPALIRKERVSRLESLEWQLKYLKCAITYLDGRFKEKSWASVTEKLRYYSTCYNHDLDATEEEIHAWGQVKIFPYGLGNPLSRYAYHEIVIDYYQYKLSQL
jgi:hypothetical protein